MVRVGLIGCGKWGRNHAKVWSELPCTFVGIADPNPSVEHYAQQLKTRYFHSIDDLLPLVDAVSVAVPTALHFGTVRKALDMGLHVLVEKPVTLHSSETAQLDEYAEAQKLILSVGYIFRFHPAVQIVRRNISRLGKIHYIAARYVGGQNRLWADSGAILNFGIHLIDILNFILHERPVRVYAKKQNILSPEREDSASVTLVYRALYATLELSCIHPEKSRDLWVVGERQKIHADFNQNIVSVYGGDVNSPSVQDGNLPVQRITLDNINPLQDQLAYFLNRVSAHKPATYVALDNISREEADTTRICEKAIQSALAGIEIDLVAGV